MHLRRAEGTLRTLAEGCRLCRLEDDASHPGSPVPALTVAPDRPFWCAPRTRRMMPDIAPGALPPKCRWGQQLPLAGERARPLDAVPSPLSARGGRSPERAVKPRGVGRHLRTLTHRARVGTWPGAPANARALPNRPTQAPQRSITWHRNGAVGVRESGGPHGQISADLSRAPTGQRGLR